MSGGAEEEDIEQPQRALIIDASVALKWLVEEEGSDGATALQEDDLAAPSLLRIEVANVLRTLAVRGMVTPEDALRRLALLQATPLRIVDLDDALEGRALEMALDLSHPVYDCIYLALAERMERRLVTADGRFVRALAGTAFEPLALPLTTQSA